MAGADSATDRVIRSQWRWDVALSFAGAQRPYVEQVAAALKARGVRCFYDADEQIELWGKYLAEELPVIYGEQAAAVVVFVSAEYAERDWTRHERRAALNRAVRERQEYVLPARFDETPLPGLLSDMAAIDLRGRTPQQFAAMIAAKLAALGIIAPAPLGGAGSHTRGVDTAHPAGAVRVGEADSRTPIRTRERRRVRWRTVLVLAVPVLAILGFASYEFIAVGHTRHASTAVGQYSRAPVVQASQGGGPRSAAASSPAARASTGPLSPSSTPSPSPVAAQPLTPASVAAFGPNGTADGDNPQNAMLAIGGNPARPWYTVWYTTARFGNLQAGTGLLLDMGHPVSVSGVLLSLGGGSGADLQLRAGSRPVLADLPPVASTSGAGDTVQWPLRTPVRVRYLLVWFTKLPPDNAGTYQAAVWDISVQGWP
jgi:TIR domain